MDDMTGLASLWSVAIIDGLSTSKHAHEQTHITSARQQLVKLVWTVQRLLAAVNNNFVISLSRESIIYLYRTMFEMRCR